MHSHNRSSRKDLDVFREEREGQSPLGFVIASVLSLSVMSSTLLAALLSPCASAWEQCQRQLNPCPGTDGSQG